MLWGALWVVAACLTPATRSLRSLPCSGRLVSNHAPLPRVVSSHDSRCPRVMMTQAGLIGKGFGGGEATRDPAPTASDPNDPKSKQRAIHKAESFAQYLASRQAAATEAICHRPAAATAPIAASAPSLPYVPLAAPAPVAAPAPAAAFSPITSSLMADQRRRPDHRPSLAADQTERDGLSDGLSRVRAHDYSCIDNGQPFVAPGWVSDELLNALRADARGLLDAGRFVDAQESLGKRIKLSLTETDWTAPGEAAGQPSEARAAARRLFDELLIELEAVLGRGRLSLDLHGAQAKYSFGKCGEPLAFHVDQRHEALGSHKDHHGAQTRRSLGWLLYLSDDGWDEPGGSGSGGKLLAYPRSDAVGRCGSHEGNLQVGWIERQRGSEPVFLDGWVAPASMAGRTLEEVAQHSAASYEDSDAGRQALWAALRQIQPAYQLYAVAADGGRENLSEVFERPASSERVPSLREMLPPMLRDSWSSTIASGHPKQTTVEVSPRGGTLVIFDAVAVPHEVSAVLAGERLALFGFVAAERPVPPRWRTPPGPAGTPVLPPSWRQDTQCEWFHEGWARDFHHHFQYTERGRFNY